MAVKKAEPTQETDPKVIPVAEPTQETDPWKKMVEVHPHKGAKGEPPYIFISLNNRNFQIPRGKVSLVPEPIYLRLLELQRCMDAEDLLYEELSKPNVNLTE